MFKEGTLNAIQFLNEAVYWLRNRLPLFNLTGRMDPPSSNDANVSMPSTGDFDQLLIMDRLTPITNPPVGSAGPGVIRPLALVSPGISLCSDTCAPSESLHNFCLCRKMKHAV